MVRQVKSLYSCNDKRLLVYRKRAWDLMDDFEALNVRSISRRKNMVANALAISASALQPVERTKLKIFSFELVVVPSILDNITNFQVFQDDQHILEFIMSSGHFKGKEIDDTPNDKPENDKIEDEDEILNLKTNTVPKGMVELEHIFDHDESALNKRTAEEKGIEECDSYNLGIDDDPKMVRVGKACTQQEREDMLKLLSEYKDIIAWSYEELKIYDPEIMTHDILLKPDAKPFRQRQRPVNPIIEPLIMKEVQKLLDAKIIFPIHHSTWVANLVPVRKKTREICLCVNFRNLNLASQKDNYPLPSLDEVLQIVNGSKMISFLDGYSGYNQIMVDEEDRLKTTFTTKWGTFAYRRMPFGLINVGTTF